MKKRITALFMALLLMLSSFTISALAAQETDNAVETTGAFDEATDLERWGLDEEYSIVPCNAGCSSVDLHGTNLKDVQIYKTGRKTNQMWTLGKEGDFYYIKSKKNEKVIEVPNGNAVTDQKLEVNTYDGSDRQLWRLEDMNDGTYSLHSKLNDSFVWDVQGANRNNGSKIMLHSQNRNNNQRFRFVHTSTVEQMSDWGATRKDCSGTDWDVWNGSRTVDWYHKHAKDTDLYINSASDLGGLASLVNNNYEMKGKTIHLTRDINLAGIDWIPIGYQGHTFRGSFNGHGHAIVGLSRTTGDDFNALFGGVECGSICNLAVKGTVSGDDHIGGVVGILQAGHIYNIYSEVTITNATDYREGGIVGAIAYGGYLEHCTQNATVNSSDKDPHRGGIAGYSDGAIRYCVNNATVNHNWNYGGGIVGTLGSGIIEYCANHGTVGCGYYSGNSGGIAGQMASSGIIFGCFNDGTINSEYDYVGGICGMLNDNLRVIGCINIGRVSGDDDIGGICGYGNPTNCLNIGTVTGDSYVGAIAGEADSAPSCYALAWTGQYLNGVSSTGADYVTASQIISGKICRLLNGGSKGLPTFRDNYALGMKSIFTQNIGGDPYPTFGSSQVSQSSSAYVNEEYRVTVECDSSYGSVEGAGAYTSGKVTLTAKPAAGCVFDHFEVKSPTPGKMTGWNGNKYDYPSETVKTYKDETITLTDNIDKSYTVRAVFTVFDDTPDDLKNSVKLELECTDDVGGWNSNIIPVDLIDSAGEKHHWEINNAHLNEVGEKTNRTFDLKTASPVAVYVTPDFGGGVTFRSYGLKARMWINGSATSLESNEVIIRSWPFISSKYGGDYMNISFGDSGKSSVGSDKTGKWTSYTSCKEAWEKAKSDPSLTLRIESVWLLDSVLQLDAGERVNLDLNGYPIIRTVKKTQNNGELFEIASGAKLTVSDSAPTRRSSGSFSGGSIQGGRSNNSAGLIECRGALVMTGGTLYNGGTTNKGGAIRLMGGGTAKLTDVLISDCWTDKAILTLNEGGAIYMKDTAEATLKDCTIRNCRALDYGGGIYMESDGNSLNCENVNTLACTANGDQGGGVYQNRGETRWVGGAVSYCRAEADDGGGFYHHRGTVRMQDVVFEGNYSEDYGGAIYADSDDGLWLIGCTMKRNSAEDAGGAVYSYYNDMYLKDCSITANATGGEGGGLYIDSPGSIGVAGKTVIRENDGVGTMDNLVLENGAVIYDHGLEPDSEIRLRSDSDGNVKLGKTLTSAYQLKEYFRADYGKLELADTETVDTELRASVFSDGRAVLFIGAMIIIAVTAGGFVCNRKRGKGEKQ
ncbi:MAG: RICIN domain-containing protein [Eubacterium sp.]|nr:RICIN domain-containing protein [Eubacterium sp.]